MSEFYIVDYGYDAGYDDYGRDQALVAAANPEHAVNMIRHALKRLDQSYEIVEVFSVKRFNGGVFSREFNME